jgi:hypothetical protein
MKTHTLNTQNPFIRGYYIDPDLCDNILKECKSKPNEFKPGIKAYDNALIEMLPEDLKQSYINTLFSVVEEYKKEFTYCYEDLVRWGLNKQIKIQRYAAGKWYKEWHCENNGHKMFSNRHLVYMTYLNDVQINGETEFLYQKLKVKPEKGLTLIWPADWTHYHKGCVAEVEEKFIITGWFTFEETK